MKHQDVIDQLKARDLLTPEFLSYIEGMVRFIEDHSEIPEFMSLFTAVEKGITGGAIFSFLWGDHTLAITLSFHVQDKKMLAHIGTLQADGPRGKPYVQLAVDMITPDMLEILLNQFHFRQGLVNAQ